MVSAAGGTGSRRDFLRLLAAAPLAAATGQESGRPLFSFAVLADIQFADKDGAGARAYRQSLEKLRAVRALLAGEKLKFVIQLGDFIDEGGANFDRIAPLYRRLPAPRYHVLGNHDFFAGREAVLKRYRLRRPYYEFRAGRWQFVVLDGMHVSVKGGWSESSPNHQAGRRLLAELKRQGAVNANDWNGAADGQQRAWLEGQLRRAAQRHERSVIFCHFPVLPESCRPDHLLWDYRQVLEVLDSAPSAVAYLNGHDHRGGYAERNGVHFLTLAGLVEHSVERALRVVDVHHDRLVVRQAGAKEGQILSAR